MEKLKKSHLLEEIRQAELNISKFSAVADYCRYLLKTYEIEEEQTDKKDGKEVVG